MLKKLFKSSFLLCLGVFLVAALLFGPHAFEYFTGTVRHIQRGVANNVPIEFELERARDMLEEIIPEMHANVKLISQEEVEIAALKTEIDSTVKPMAMEREAIENLNQQLCLHKASYQVGGHQFTRQELTDDLANRFERFKESEMIKQSKEKMLKIRESSLANAIKNLENTKKNKQLLQNKIASLESKYRLIQASSVGTEYSIDNSKLSQTEKLISQINKRLDVAERVLANEGRFLENKTTANITVEDAVNEQELIGQIRDYFNSDVNSDTPEETLNTQVVDTEALVVAEAR